MKADHFQFSEDQNPDSRRAHTEPVPEPPEPFVSADEAAHFLCVKRRFLLELARRGIAGAYPLGTGTKRKIWVFRLSELASAIERDENLILNSRKPCTI